MALNFPLNPVEGQLYPDPAIAGTPQWVYKAGGWNMVSTAGSGTPINVALDVYSLAVATGANGAVDLTKEQVKRITNNTNTAKAITFTNAPAGRAMTVALMVVGNAGTVTMPSGTRFASGVDTTLATTRTLFILFWDGTDWLVTANIKSQT